MKAITRERLRDLFWQWFPDLQQEHLAALHAQMALTASNPKYERITNVLLLASTFNPLMRLFPGRPVGLAPGVWMAYHFCRQIDDIVDGDIDLPKGYESFSELQKELNEAMATGQYPNTDLGLLLRGTMRDMKTYYGIDVRNRISKFLDAMATENNRRLNRTMSTREELNALYQASFETPIDLAFIAAGSSARSANLPQLAEAQGRVYAIRDLEEDLSHGRIFVPKEVGLSVDELVSQCTSPQLERWKEEELSEGRQLINRLRQEKLDWRGGIIVGFLVNGMVDYIQQAR